MRALFILVLFLGVLSGCSRGSEARCVEGASAECACPGGAKGAQVCTAEGSFGPCDCGPAAAAETPQAGDPPAGEPGPAAAGDAIVVTAKAFGPLASETRVDRASLERLFPGAEVKEAIESDEGEEWTVYQVHRDGALVLTVTPSESGTVAGVEGRSSAVRLESGLTVGSTYEEAAKLGPMECQGGFHASAEQILCSLSNLPVTLAFAIGTDKHYMAEIDAKEQAKILAGKKVEAIFWRAP